MRRLVCVKQTFPLAVSARPLSTSCMVGVLAFDVLNVSSSLAWGSAAYLTSSYHSHSDEPIRAPCMLGFDYWGAVLPSAMRPHRTCFPLAVTGTRSAPGRAMSRKHSHPRGPDITSTDFACPLVLSRHLTLQ